MWERTKKAAVTRALQEFVARRQPQCARELMGKQPVASFA